MLSTQLACPHCGSTLNFGIEIAAGTPVECLICLQAFAATDPVVVRSEPAAPMRVAACSLDTVEMTAVADPVTLEWPHSPTMTMEAAPPVALAPETISADPAPAAVAIAMPAVPPKPRAPKQDVLVSKPYQPPTSTAIAQKPMPIAAPALPRAEKTQPMRSTPGADDAEESAVAKKIVLYAVTCALLLLLTGGIVIGAWKLMAATRGGSVEDKDAQYTAKDPNKTGTPNDPKKDPVGPVEEPEDEDALRARIEEEVKQTLKRQNAVKPGVIEADPDPLVNVRSAPLTPQQIKINTAIEKGVAYLKKTQHANGTWHGGHPVGHAAIGGLTLIECNVPRDDPAVLRAAGFVRSNTSSLNYTYELSLAILFLDRLGDPRDRPLIQAMALRLMAGQNDYGGWTYHCPVLPPKDMLQLYNFLQSHRQPEFANPLGSPGAKTQAGIVLNPTRDPIKLDAPFREFEELVLAKGIDASGTMIVPAKKDGLIVPVNPNDPKPMPVRQKVTPINPDTLPANLRTLPIVTNQGVKKKSPKLKHGGGDNSNTQFAMLALWAARRHEAPTDQALLLSYQRFMTSQNNDGSWGYHPGDARNPHTMTNVGLLGLAMGHGAVPDIINYNPKTKETVIKPALEDPTIQRGLKALSRHIRQPAADPDKGSFPMENLYMLWSIERVAMLYDLKTIGGKDWYGWGSQILVYNQNGAGAWSNGGGYHGANEPLNTCFALLFLRRSNLVQDLTNNLRLRTAIVDPEK